MAESSRGTGSQNKIQLTAGAAISAAEIWQLRDGRCARKEGGGASSGALSTFVANDTWVVPKTAGVVILDGGRVYWDHSANAATYRGVNDRDFYMGRSVGDAASADTTMTVNFNIPEWSYDIDPFRYPFATTIVGTQALGGLAINDRGGKNLVLSSTNEAQKLDMLGKDGFATGAKAIVEFMINVISDGAGSAPDFNIGIANASHATDADSITAHLFLHLDGNSVNINFQSKDGTTTVASTDSTVDYTEGSSQANRVECWLDMRSSSDVQVYLNGVNVLPATVFNVSAHAGTWYPLVHLEKTAAADVYEVDVERFLVRKAQQ